MVGGIHTHVLCCVVRGKREEVTAGQMRRNLHFSFSADSRAAVQFPKQEGVEEMVAFRPVFQHLGKSATHWFPGHMAAGLCVSVSECE